MKVFPVDSVVTSLGDDGLPIYDRPFVSADLRDVYGEFFSNGVFYTSANIFKVSASTGGMVVTVQGGKAHINGAFGTEEDVTTLTVPTASTQNNRIDTVVIRLDLGVDARSMSLDIVQGTPAANPVRPDLTRGETVWELGIADISVAAGQTQIVTANITDTRSETERCGFVEPFAVIDTTEIFKAANDAADLATAAAARADAVAQRARKQADCSCEGLQEQIDVLAALVADIYGKPFFMGETLVLPTDRGSFSNENLTITNATISGENVIITE